jgi:hypothetical protein
MYVTHVVPPIIHTLLAHGAGLGVLRLLTGLVLANAALSGALVGSQSIAPSSSRLRLTANKIYSRMRFLRLNETQLSERCSLAAIHLFEDAEVPSLTRDRVSKILMNRQDFPAKSAARIITRGELIVLANVLKVSVEWLVGQDENRDPIVWNVLANPDRVAEFAHVLHAHEEAGNESKVWSQYPMHAYTSEAFIHSFNQLHYGTKPGIANPRSLVEFYNRVARARRKRILRPGRRFQYTSLLYRSHLEDVICGQGLFSAISKTILRNNVEVMIDTITNPSLRIKLVVIKEDYVAGLEAVRNYEILSTVDTVFSSWNYHNGDVGWSEHPSYTQPNRRLLDRMSAHSLFRDVNETVDYIRSLQSRHRNGPK